MKIVLIDRTMSQIRSQEGDDLKDAIEAFWSSVWEQGWNPDERILQTYGDWTVLIETPSGKLIPQGLLKDSPFIPLTRQPQPDRVPGSLPDKERCQLLE